MSSKLEDRLLQYEKSTPISNDEELLHAIKCIINEEESVPIEKRDLELVEEAIKATFSLKKIDIAVLNKHADKLKEKYVSEARFDNTSKVKKEKIKSVNLKWFIPIAAIISILTASTLVAYAFGYDFVSITKSAYVQFKEKIFYRYGNSDIIITDDYTKYQSLEMLSNDDKYSNVLLPFELPDNFTVTEIIAQDFGEYTSIDIKLLCNGVLQQIDIETPTSFNFSNRETIRINGFDVYCCEYDNIFQGELLYEGSIYTISASSYNNLEIIIKSLEK